MSTRRTKPAEEIASLDGTFFWMDVYVRNGNLVACFYDNHYGNLLPHTKTAKDGPSRQKLIEAWFEEAKKAFDKPPVVMLS